MLTYLHVKNIALIDELEVEFDDGLNIMTGETGAGKSIIVGSINAVLGNKTLKDFIRKDEEYALIELLFQELPRDALDKLRELDISTEGELLISRKISQNGRSIFKLNGQVINAQDVREISSLLIDLHSQHEHQSLLEKKNHGKLLDRYLGDQAASLLDKLKNYYKDYLDLRSEIEIETNEEDRKRQISFLEFEVSEIEDANLQIGEDERLEAAFRKQSNLKQIKETLSTVQFLLSDNEMGANASFEISKAIEALYKVKGLDDAIAKLTDHLEQIDYMLGDFCRELLDYAKDLYPDEESLEETRLRIDLINHLKMKHGTSIEKVLEALEEKKSTLNDFLNFEHRKKRLGEEIVRKEKEIEKLCGELSRLRQEGAKTLSLQITEALKDLNLNNTNFKIDCKRRERFHSDGWDDIEFLISTNIGEALKPLVKIASGGELSRVMLAIKSVFSDYDDVPTLIFDEIDNGISGRTAQKVAEKMVRLSRSRQIISITHLPQIAAMADHHYLIEKSVEKDRAYTKMLKLKENEMPSELSRLIGGTKITEIVEKSAIEMKNLANNLKNEIK